MFCDKAVINLISQAPGKVAHDKNIAWLDASGKRLRRWLGLSESQFYQQQLVNVLPMSFCFPGYKNGADAPPLKACAPQWHPHFLSLSNASLTIYLGRYAQQNYLPQYATLTAAVQDYEALLNQNCIALPHPSGRNNRWLKRYAWFEQSTLPALRTRIRNLLAG
ncbi:uracil-DNA glycosylase family protein [Alteromonas sp. ASW11-36]|uniref:Uracil-DNA glycosylase family protein n=2 Tax=Alteromonas arenosi TaxID=3055817 RepID=A0ABT7T0Y3_9ALTE|nr:uracil-DNA glycosylase family protein [Alteromonas sp. ASW11-36]